MPTRATLDQDPCQILDELLHAIGQLDAHPLASGVQYSLERGLTLDRLRLWESKHEHLLPDDCKALLVYCNGFTLRWNLRSRGQAAPFGVIHVNGIDSLTPLAGPRVKVPPDYVQSSATQSVQLAAFDIDRSCPSGRVAFVYGGFSGPRVLPQVWFQDPAGSWFFLAESFLDYFRLLALHLGVPHWQFAFTEVGLDSNTRNWMALFCPERLVAAESGSLDPSGSLGISPGTHD